MPVDLTQYYTVAQVAQILGVSQKSVRDFINSGELQAVKIGQWRISEEGIQQFIQSRMNEVRSNMYQELQQFVDSKQVLSEGQVRTLVVRDYFCEDGKQYTQLLKPVLKRWEGSPVKWRFIFEKELRLARHILHGDWETIKEIVAELDEIAPKISSI